MTTANLIEPEEYFSAVFSASPDMISISLLAGGTYLRVNDAFLENSGYSLEEVIGRTSEQLGLWAEKDGRGRFQSILLNRRRVRDLEVLLRVKNGEVRNYQLSAAIVTIGEQECIVTMSRETTDRTALVERLEKSRFLLERAEEMANIGSWELDYESGKVAASLGASRIYGFEPDKFTVKSTEKVPLEQYRTELDNARDRLINEGIPYDIEFKIRRQNDGAIRDIHSKAQWDKSKRRMFGIIRDITVEKAAEAEILKLNKNLENLVASRTQELLEANTLLSAALGDIKNAQRELVLSEKLAAVGQLSAGIAHEINTPLGAIVSANGTITRFLGTTLPRTIDSLAGLTPSQKVLYARLVHEVINEKGRDTRTGSRRSRLRLLREQLEAIDFHGDHQIEDLLLELGLDDLPEQVPEFFLEDCCVALLERVWEIYSAWKMANVVDLAAHKASEVVSALRQYLGNQAPGDIGVVDVERDLEVALTLLHNKIKFGVVVEKNFSGVRVLGSAQDLSQVWINLINNAIQAMDYKGKLIITTRKSEDSALICIIDSGPGIPEAIKDRVFEPFFTTKKSGEGIGIGLDICQRTVTRNHGLIELDSCPGRTCFTVKLPLAQGE